MVDREKHPRGWAVFKAEVAGWDPEGAKYYAKLWEKALAQAAGVKPKTLQAALDRVYWDGYYGPVSDQEWVEQDGRPMKLSRAKEIVRDAYDNFDPPDFQITNPELAFGDPSPTQVEIDEHFDSPPTDAQLQAWYDEVYQKNAPWASGKNYPNEESFQTRYLHNVFGFYREIYGQYPGGGR